MSPPPEARAVPMTMPVPSELLRVAMAAADAADAVVRSRYTGSFQVRLKADQTPVTEVDEAAEAAVREVLRQAFPDHGFYGEEGGPENLSAEWLWLVDPIDGTKAFVRGYPMFSTQIALMHEGRLVLGVSSAPCYDGGERYVAETGSGAWHMPQGLLERARHLKASPVTDYPQATLSLGNVASLARREKAWAELGAIIPRLHRIRGYGDFLHYHLLASGRLDAVVESDVNILDIAALAVIVTEAGGTFTTLEGGLPGLAATSVCAAATPELHARLLDALGANGPAGPGQLALAPLVG